MRRKADLPTKICVACGRPFAWRKKWERDWDQVRYCSERCRRQGAASAAPEPAEALRSADPTKALRASRPSKRRG